MALMHNTRWATRQQLMEIYPPNTGNEIRFDMMQIVEEAQRDPNRAMMARDTVNGPAIKWQSSKAILRLQREWLAELDDLDRAADLDEANRRALRAERHPLMWWLR